MYLTDIDLDILKKLGPFKCNNDIILRYISKIDLHNLVSCKRDIFAYNSLKTLNLPNLESCGGQIVASSATTVNLPKLKYSNGISLESATTLNLPNLEECFWHIITESATRVDLPKLVNCTGDIYAYSATTVNLPKLEYCVFIYVGSNTKKIIIPESLRHKLKRVPDDCEIIHPQIEPKLESFKQYFFRI